MKAKIAILLIIYLLFTVENLHAVPTGSDLFFACSQAQENGFDSMQGQMCTWYVIPCNCSLDEELPDVCAPDGIEVTELADIVIEGLSVNAEFMSQTATKSAAMILSKEFPCDNGNDY